MLSLEPADFVNFDARRSKTMMNIKNIAKCPVTFKIQTTAPEKYRVRPHSGVLGPNESSKVRLWFKHEKPQTTEEVIDKFLIMGLPAARKDCSPAEVAAMWPSESATSPQVEKHHLVCRFGASGKV